MGPETLAVLDPWEVGEGHVGDPRFLSSHVIFVDAPSVVKVVASPVVHHQKRLVDLLRFPRGEGQGASREYRHCLAHSGPGDTVC